MLTSSSSGALMRRVGVEEAFRLFKASGLDAMDFPIDDAAKDLEYIKNSKVYGKTEEEIFEYYGNIKKIADKYGIVIGQTHPIFGSVEMASTPEFKEVTQKSLIATAALGAHVAVVHPIKLHGFKFDRDMTENIDFDEAFYRDLIPYAEKYNVKIAIENMFGRDDDGNVCPSCCSRPADMNELIRRLGTEHFCFCVDTGHFGLTAKGTGISVGDAIRQLGSNIGVIHLQEVDGLVDRHVIPYTFNNTMDWDDITAALREVGYKGIMNLEVMPYLKTFPDDLLPEAMRRIGVMARYMANKVEG